MSESLKTWNYKSDFQLDITPKLDGEAVSVPIGVPFVVTIYGSAGTYTASYTGRKYKHCSVSGNVISVYVNDHHLGVGRLKVDVWFKYEDTHYEYGKDLHVVVDTGYALVAGNGNQEDADFSVDAALPYALVTAYDLAAANGYDGTAEGFYAALGKVVSDTEASEKATASATEATAKALASATEADTATEKATEATEKAAEATSAAETATEDAKTATSAAESAALRAERAADSAVRSYLDIRLVKVNESKAPEKPTVIVDGEKIELTYGRKYRLYPKKSFATGTYWIYSSYWPEASNYAYAIDWMDTSHLDTSNFTSLSAFALGGTFDSLEAGAFDTSNVESLECAFAKDTNLTSVDCWSWDTGKVTNMQLIFGHCNSLEEFEGLGWDTSKVTEMNGMFYNCKALRSIDLTGWTIGETRLSQMFCGCTSLTKVDMAGWGWDTSKVTNMNAMFSSCTSLTEINLKGLDTSNLMYIESTFYGCKALTSLDLMTLDTRNVISLYSTFSGCSSLTSLDLGTWDTSKVTRFYFTFYNCTSLTSLDLSSWDMGSVTNLYEPFLNCAKLATLLLGPNFFKMQVSSINFSGLSAWKDDSVQTSLVTNLYDRKTNGLSTFTLRLHANTKAVLSDADKATITSKGYTIA